jgi:DNA-binding transcriptional ArsR family regulator
MLSDLEALFTSGARVQILSLFLGRPEYRFYQREIERETGQPIRAVQREVARLTDIGLLCRSEEGNRVFYGLHFGFPLLPELTALFEKASGEQGQRPSGRRTGTRGRETQAAPQPFSWLDSLPAGRLPESLRRLQVEGEWDRAY